MSPRNPTGSTAKRKPRAAPPAAVPATRRTVIIENVAPSVDGGRYAAKREIGTRVEVSADVFKEGHDVLAAWVLYRHETETAWREAPMRFVDNDRWGGEIVVDRLGRWLFTVEAMNDAFQSWLADLAKRVDAKQDVASELKEGAALVATAAERASGSDARRLSEHATRLARGDANAARNPDLAALMARHRDRSQATRCPIEFPLQVDRERARFAAWYEFFPRSGSTAERSATFKEAQAQLERAAAMGFDVVYLPPIHPIGRSHRKGRNNTLTSKPGDPGSPWAIGGAEGGHDAVHPDLGTIEDFDDFVAKAGELGLDVALDFAIQCSPDHPYVREHPEWFFHRPDGTIKYAENPPKKYQDVYPVNFYTEDIGPLWAEMKRVVEFWVGHGVKTFRVDNPHTKPVVFWEWMIREIQREHPDVVFLAEAFTRPKMMKVLAKIGFTQSYTYFTWRNEKTEIREYLEEITEDPVAEYLRGNLWPNTPDILHATLVRGGRPAFKMRLVLAATLSSLYGMYSGYELCEHVPVAPTSEEYLDSEKYEVKARDWNAPGNLSDFITRVNTIRRGNRALQLYRNLRFYQSDSPHILWYGKMTEDRENAIFVAVNLDPTAERESMVEVPLDVLGIPANRPYTMHELLSDRTWEWVGPRGFVKLYPDVDPAQVFRLER
ncbi:MAG: alpha-1,4-glucan--maltose-1-phosphate maltosyltransferase [Candidatus Rokubacteria bacterium]|nr:alpha-1,4-glucan--maltose-1-phosphate maltosyltransferase [Candidatus Rokubacteria bacterium]